jgi:hypothetical protein
MFREIAVRSSGVPAIDAACAEAVELKGGNTFEISGRVTAGTGKLYVLRRLVYEKPVGTQHFQFRPWAEDRPADSAEFVDGWFSIRLRILEGNPIEQVALWNPSGALTIDPAVPVLIRECPY